METSPKYPAINSTVYFAPHVFGMPYGPCRRVTNRHGEADCIRFETRQSPCTVPMTVFDQGHIVWHTNRLVLAALYMRLVLRARCVKHLYSWGQ